MPGLTADRLFRKIILIILFNAQVLPHSGVITVTYFCVRMTQYNLEFRVGSFHLNTAESSNK